MARPKKVEIVVPEVSREEKLAMIKESMAKNLAFSRECIHISEYDIQNPVIKPDLTKFAPVVTFTEDGEPHFALKKGDNILIQKIWPSRPTVTAEVVSVYDDGYMTAWNYDDNHFEVIGDWRIYEDLGGMLRIPEGKLKHKRATKEEKAEIARKKKEFKERVKGIDISALSPPSSDTSSQTEDIVASESETTTTQGETT